MCVQPLRVSILFQQSPQLVDLGILFLGGMSRMTGLWLRRCGRIVIVIVFRVRHVEVAITCGTGEDGLVCWWGEK